MSFEQDTMLTPKQRNKIVVKALRDHYKNRVGVIGRSRVPSDYLLMFLEGGEADAISYAIAAEQEHRTRKMFIREVYSSPSDCPGKPCEGCASEGVC